MVNSKTEYETKVSVILTCFNRKEKTLKCVESLIKGNPKVKFSFIIVDDQSTDGTVEELKKLEYDIKIKNGNGKLFWSGGMRVGISEYLENDNKSNYVLLVNDDVEFYDNILKKMIERSIANSDAVVVGATCDDLGNFTYGALKLNDNRKRGLYYHINPTDEFIQCDTFNANCVLIKSSIIKTIGNFDDIYRHSLADLDYGFTIRRNGYNIISSNKFVGICHRNSTKGTWHDKSLSRLDRIKKKESIKGSPFKQWFYFMNKNFGYVAAVRYSISPYIRILLGK